MLRFRTTSPHRPRTGRRLFGLDRIALSVSIAVLAPGGLAIAQTTTPTPPPGPAILQGKVVTNLGHPAARTRIRLEELSLETTTDAEGTFRLEAPQAGDYTISAVSELYGSSVRRVRMAAGQVVELLVTLDIAVHLEEVTVTANPEGRRRADVAQPVTVVSGRDLQAARQATLGETLTREAGIHSSSFGPGASRPIIRGLGADRVRILEGGVGAGDASNVSPDHAVSLDPLIAERVEVVRGPATLLYGSHAFGGVVNVLDERVPERRPTEPFGGVFDLGYGSAAEEGSGALSLTGGGGPIAWQVRALSRHGSDYESGDGVVPNSALDTEEGQAGVSWVGERGFVGLAFDTFATRYGIPTDELISIDMERDRFDLRGDWNIPDAAFRGLRLRATLSDYEHVELEADGAVGTRFTNDAWEARLEAPHREVGPFQGTLGLQAASRDFEAIGDEAIVPPSLTENRAVFLLEEFGPQQARFSLGARYEEQTVEAAGGPPKRTFDSVSGSGGFIWNRDDRFAVAVSLSSVERPPTAEELYVNGAHPATAQFEIGDPNLGLEQGIGLDLALRRLKGRVQGELNLFSNRFDDFIFLQGTGATDPGSGFPIFAYTQQDAEFRGAELHADVDLWHEEPHHLGLEIVADTVRAENRATGEPLPFIPPWRAGLGLHYQGLKYWGRVEGRHTAEQDRLAPFETPTDAYTLLNAAGGVRFVGRGLVHDLMLVANNITDRLARNHVSPLKEFAPLPGRDLRLVYRLVF